ncbi:MAG TPA: hypothetical protein VGA67_01300 [Candidatus Dojkabacteria bacterium]|jgi:hypothetical protein
MGNELEGYYEGGNNNAPDFLDTFFGIKNPSFGVRSEDIPFEEDRVNEIEDDDDPYANNVASLKWGKLNKIELERRHRVYNSLLSKTYYEELFINPGVSEVVNFLANEAQSGELVAVEFQEQLHLENNIEVLLMLGRNLKTKPLDFENVVDRIFEVCSSLKIWNKEAEVDSCKDFIAKILKIGMQIDDPEWVNSFLTLNNGNNND